MAAPTIPSAASTKKAGPSVGQKIAIWWTKSAKNLDLFDENSREKVKTDPWFMLGGMALMFWYITIVTGTILMFYYVPDATGPIYQSWLSVKNILEGQSGWVIYLTRQLHKYGADALIVALTMRIYRMYFRGEFKSYNQLSYMLTIIGLIAALPLVPDILKATLGVAQIGHIMANYMLSGLSIGPATLTRFYSAHFMLSILTIILVEAYFARKGKGDKGVGGAGRVPRINLPWYSVLGFLIILVAISIFVPVETGSPANYSVTPNPILSDWYFLGLYQMMKLWKPASATLQTVLLPLVAFIVVFLDYSTERNPWKRPFWTMVGIYGLVSWLAFSILIILSIADIHRDPPYIYLVSMIMLGGGAIWHLVQRARNRREQKAIEAAKAQAAVIAADKA
jgi:quinol-cytochrome oxidoreductase complex cytochrome b subunit